MNLVKHMSSNTTDRACLAYIRQSAFDKRQSLPRVSYTSTMKQIMGCYHLHIERTQTVRKNSSVGNDRPLSLICLLRSSSFSEAGLQALPSVLASVHGPACVLLYSMFFEKTTRGLSLRTEFSLLFVDTVFIQELCVVRKGSNVLRRYFVKTKPRQKRFCMHTLRHFCFRSP